MKDKILLILSLSAIISITIIHNLYYYIFFIIISFLLAGKRSIIILKKTFSSIFFFNFLTSISYIIIFKLKGEFSLNYLLLMNLRVFSITTILFLTINKINLFKAFSFSSSLSFLLTLSYSQIITYKKIFEDFRLALKSRSIKKITYNDKWGFVTSLIYFFLSKSISNSKEISQAMKSRGFLSD